MTNVSSSSYFNKGTTVWVAPSPWLWRWQSRLSGPRVRPHAFAEFSPRWCAQVRRRRGRRNCRSVGASRGKLAEPARGNRRQGVAATRRRGERRARRLQARRGRVRADHPRPGQDHLYRPQLFEPCRRDGPRVAQGAEPVLAPARHADRPRRADGAAHGLDQFRLRGRARHRDRRELPRRPRGAGALGGRGLQLLRRRQRARLPEAFGDGGQELPLDRPARAVDDDGGRDLRSAEAVADDAAERQRGAERHHRPHDLRRRHHHRIRLDLHAARTRRRHRHRHAGRRRRRPQAAALDEGGRQARGRDLRHRHVEHACRR